MTFQIGDVYRAKTGELLKVGEFVDGECEFQILHPETKEPTDYYLYGPLENLADWAAGMGLKQIDLATHKPTGLK